MTPATTRTSGGDPGARRRIEIWSRRIAREEGGEARHAMVYCPARSRSLPVGECSRCEHASDGRAGAGESDAFLYCSFVPARRAGGGGLGEGGGDATEVVGEARSSLRRACATPIAWVMERDVLCVEAELSLQRLVSLFLAENLSAAPVVDGEGRPIGMVSKTDLVRQRYEHGEAEPEATTTTEPTGRSRARPTPEPLGAGFHVERIEDRSVADIMTPLAFTLTGDTPIAQAAAVMAFEGVHQLPVTSPDAHVIGILTSLDVLAWLAEQDGYVLGSTEPRLKDT